VVPGLLAESGQAVKSAVQDRLYTFAWGNNERRAELVGRVCRKIARGAKGTALVEFLDTGERVTCSFRALRKYNPHKGAKP
jgi:hypothetical protein